MKFYTIENKPVEDEQLQEEYKSGYSVDTIHLGSDNLFFRTGFRKYFIPYSQIYRFYRRVKVVPARFCCGRLDLEIEYLVICDKKKEIAEIQLSSKKIAQDLIKRLTVLIPDAKVGIKKSRQKELSSQAEEQNEK